MLALDSSSPVLVSTIIWQFSQSTLNHEILCIHTVSMEDGL
jgi:hypothetical protein